MELICFVSFTCWIGLMLIGGKSAKYPATRIVLGLFEAVFMIWFFISAFVLLLVEFVK